MKRIKNFKKLHHGWMKFCDKNDKYLITMALKILDTFFKKIIISFLVTDLNFELNIINI